MARLPSPPRACSATAATSKTAQSYAVSSPAALSMASGTKRLAFASMKVQAWLRAS